MSEEVKGKISVETENIFPIIKKWLYSDKDIFLRELVSNASDAISKLKNIALTEEVEGGSDYRIDLDFEQKERTLSISDNGIGMTEEEIQKYINQIAFSGAEEFVKKFEKEGHKPDIIGHFGLGFYSCFMVAKKVVIESKSYQKDSQAIIWESESGTDFTLRKGDKKERGTKITLYLDQDSGEYLDKWKLKELIKKYSDFLPVPIHVSGEKANRQTPLWSEPVSQIKQEDYKEFYNYLFPFSTEPLFWLHLNVDYPFRLQGILFFPKIKHELDVSQNGIKLFCNHVFVSDEAAELIPQFLTVLKGTLDIPDLPLNVSRSYLQNDPLVQKISAHIVKKVADKIKEEQKRDPEEFEKNWEHMSMFLKYGMMTDERFYDAAKDLVFFLSSEGGLVKLSEYWERNQEKNGKKVYYANEADLSSVYMDMLKSQGIEVLITDNRMDGHFIQFLETKNPDMSFQRADADLAEQVVDSEAESNLVDSENKTNSDKIVEFFKSSLGQENLEIKAQALKSEGIPAVVLMPEHIRRVSEMNLMGGDYNQNLMKNHSLVVNSKSKLVQNILKISSGLTPDKGKKLARAVYDLALLSSRTMDDKEMSEYMKRTTELLEELTN